MFAALEMSYKLNAVIKIRRLLHLSVRVIGSITSFLNPGRARNVRRRSASQASIVNPYPITPEIKALYKPGTGNFVAPRMKHPRPPPEMRAAEFSAITSGKGLFTKMIVMIQVPLPRIAPPTAPHASGEAYDTAGFDAVVA